MTESKRALAGVQDTNLGIWLYPKFVVTNIKIQQHVLCSIQASAEDKADWTGSRSD